MYFPKAASDAPSSLKAEATAGAAAGAGDISGRFDPSALERGAKALKELDSSSNSKAAFEVIRLQEQTRQKELALEGEKQLTARSQAQLQRAQVEGDEKRKTISHQQDQERHTQRYKAELESQLYQKKLADQQKQNEEWLAQQHQQFLQHEDMRKKNEEEAEARKMRTLEAQAQWQRENDKVRVAAEGDARTKQERENVDVRIREMHAKAKEDYKARIDSIQTTFSSIGSGLNTLLTDKDKLMWTVGGLSMLALGYFTAKNGTRVAANLAEKALGKPPLVREFSGRGLFRNPFKAAPKGKVLDKIVLHDALAERLQWTSNALVNTKKNNMPFQHLLLHGPPGTGKTLFAQTLAKQSGLDYAIMTGGDVGPLGKEAVHEINKLFDWAKGSKKGLILFIDEADAFLRRGREADGMSEETRQVLSTFLHHTGTEQSNFAVILATNQKSVLDKAVLDRVDSWFELPLPDKKERRLMIDLFFAEHLLKPNPQGKTIQVEHEVLSDGFLDSVADRTAGFSGRQMSKLVTGLQAAVYGSGEDTVLTKGLAETVLTWKLAHFDEEVTAEHRERAAQMRAAAGTPA
jgi:ATPase family AAA domain-containing protein 3A/B